MTQASAKKNVLISSKNTKCLISEKKSKSKIGKKIVQPMNKSPCNQSKSTSDIVCFCIYCHKKCDEENLEDDWIMCTKCKKWCHESCAPLERGQKSFICDFCYI
jgi:hypothetical protein